MAGDLYIVATPIGNLADITFRAIEVLGFVDIIACENRDRHIKLLNHYQIKKRLIEYSPANERNSSKGIVKLLLEGKNVALVSDAGVPTLSDPGRVLIQDAVKEGVRVIPIPGASAITAIASVSTEHPKRLVFLGFLSKSNSKQEKELLLFKEMDCSIIVFVSQYHIKFFLNTINKIFGNVDIIIGREMTKINEEFIRGKVVDLVNCEFEERGEFTVEIENYL